MTQISVFLIFRLLVLCAVLGVAGALSFGYLGWIHPAFDAFSHFRIHLAALLLIAVPVLMLLRFWPEAAFAALLAVTSIVSTTGLPWLSPLPSANASDSAGREGETTGAVYRLFHANLRFDNARPEAILSLIGQYRPDVMTFNEVSDHWRTQLEVLRGVYPYSVVCPRHAEIGGVAIFSRRPFAHGIAPICGDRGSFAHAVVDLGGHNVDVATLHLGWPWPFDQNWQIKTVLPMLQKVGETALFAGDLNAVPWSNTARKVEAGLNATIIRGLGPTWLTAMLPDRLRPLIGLPIDNVMTKGRIVPLSARTLTGGSSDHLPVLMEFGLRPAEEQQPVLSVALQ